MDTVSYSKFRKYLAHYMSTVQSDRIPLNVRRGTVDSVVVLSETEYREIMEDRAK
jgi:PHD/YefM family antitoxin component YafN of YafNO toxin-antitoxin module